ncbi:MAG: lipopolysaccharide transport periplasmic protein LptA [Nitrospinota bacterium]
MRERGTGRRVLGALLLLALGGSVLLAERAAAQEREGGPPALRPAPGKAPGLAKPPSPGARRARSSPGAATPLFFSKPRGGDPGKPVPVHITADHLDADNKKKIAIFTGNVVAVKGDLTIRSDKLTIYHDEEGRKVDRIVAEGQVLIDQEKRKFATGERAVYHAESERVVLTGKPKAWEGPNQLVGDKIEFFMNEDRSVVYSSAERRVQVTLYPRREEEGGPRTAARTRR